MNSVLCFVQSYLSFHTSTEFYKISASINRQCVDCRNENKLTIKQAALTCPMACYNNYYCEDKIHLKY